MTVKVPASAYYTTTAGKKLHYLRTGNQSGPLLLCLHGLGGSSDTFTPLLSYFPSNHNTVLLDFPGFGKSPALQAPKTISVAGHVADVSELIQALQLQSQHVVIIGHSLGAIVALQYAAQSPESVGGLVLLGAGRAAGHVPAARQRMCDLATTVRANGVAVAADVAAKSNFYDDTSVFLSARNTRVLIDE
jgi:3-oxoadipate enol-lactonase